MEIALVIIVVALAGAFVLKAHYKKWKGVVVCGPVCGSCTQSKNCILPGEDGP